MVEIQEKRVFETNATITDELTGMSGIVTLRAEVLNGVTKLFVNGIESTEYTIAFNPNLQTACNTFLSQVNTLI